MLISQLSSYARYIPLTAKSLPFHLFHCYTITFTVASPLPPINSSTFCNLALRPNPTPSREPAFSPITSSVLKTMGISQSLFLSPLLATCDTICTCLLLESTLSWLNSSFSGHSFSMTFICPFLNPPYFFKVCPFLTLLTSC